MAEQVIVAAGSVDRGPRARVLKRTPDGDPAGGRLVSGRPNPRPCAMASFRSLSSRAARGMIYGFPDFEGRGVEGRAARPWPDRRRRRTGTRRPVDAELEPVTADARRTHSRCRWAARSSATSASTPTRPRADVFAWTTATSSSSTGCRRIGAIIVASPCSGHGAKFATAIGAMLADMALDRQAEAPAAFRLDRFSGFSGR